MTTTRDHMVARLEVLGMMADRSPADANLAWECAVGIVGPDLARRVDHLTSKSERIDQLVRIIDTREVT